MNDQPIVITEPRLHIKIIDSILTFIAWGGFIYLIIHEYQSLHDGDYSRLHDTARTLFNYFLCAMIYIFIFILWAKYNQFFFSQERRRRKKTPNQATLAESFAITVQELEKLESHRLIKVFHHPSGQIKRCEILSLSAKRQ